MRQNHIPWTPREGFLPAISVQQPWSWIITNDYKGIENREWTTSYRGPILIHAGQRPDLAFFNRHGDLIIPMPFSQASLYACLKQAPSRKNDFPRGIVGIATLTDIVIQSTSPWFCGPYGFVLEDAHPIEPAIPFLGHPGLFAVDVTLLLRVNGEKEESNHGQG